MFFVLFCFFFFCFFVFFFFFFFQAEDGIRDKLVTGVQTCALPISALNGVTGKAITPPNLARSSAGFIRAVIPFFPRPGSGRGCSRSRRRSPGDRKSVV